MRPTQSCGTAGRPGCSTTATSRPSLRATGSGRGWTMLRFRSLKPRRSRATTTWPRPSWSWPTPSCSGRWSSTETASRGCCRLRTCRGCWRSNAFSSVVSHDPDPPSPRCPREERRRSVFGMSSSPATAHRRKEIPPPFGRIVCGIDGSRSSPVAVEQAIALSGPSTALVFVCVRDTRGAGATRQATISTDRADAALEDAIVVAREAGIDAAAEILPGHDPRSVLLDEASRADLLVVASHGGSRAGGIALGSTASAAVHRAQVPVLVARRTPEAVAFPERILVATDGSPDAARAVELAARIGHCHRSTLYLLTVDAARHGDAHQVAAEIVDLRSALGERPAVIRASGKAAESILETAASESVALVVLGSRGLSGARALG